MVVAVSDEADKTVSDYIDALGIQIPVAAGSQAGGAYGVRGIPHSVLVDPQGKVAWSGSPYSISKGAIKDALKGAKKGARSFLAVPVDEPPAGRLAPHAKAMEQGNPGKALAPLLAFASDAKATDEEKSGAAALVAAIEEHVALLNRQAEALVKSRDVLRALAVFDALAKEFGAAPPGEAGKKRAAELRADPAIKKEIAGAEALQRAIEQAAKLASSKAKAKYQEVVDKHKGTRAAERAAALLRKN